MKLKRGKKSGLAYFGYSDIKEWESCYEPIRYIPETWRGTAVDVLKMNNISFEDRLWCVCRDDITSNRITRLFAVWCARQVQHLMKDKRSLDALDVAERFANGLATEYELAAAQEASNAVANAAAWNFARDAAMYAGSGTAWNAANSAAYTTCSDPAWGTARDAANVLAWSIPSDDADDGILTNFRSAARDAVRDAQRDKLIEMLLEEGKEYVEKKGRKNG